jgi:hypothetical protein
MSARQEAIANIEGIGNMIFWVFWNKEGMAYSENIKKRAVLTRIHIFIRKTQIVYITSFK